MSIFGGNEKNFINPPRASSVLCEFYFQCMAEEIVTLSIIFADES